MKISIFSGGRGNKNLFEAFTKEQCKHELNVIVNGLDDGASTGDIRRLMDYKIHGISDFLKTITAFSNDPFIDPYNGTTQWRHTSARLVTSDKRIFQHPSKKPFPI